MTVSQKQYKNPNSIDFSLIFVYSLNTIKNIYNIKLITLNKTNVMYSIVYIVLNLKILENVWFLFEYAPYI